MTKERFMKLTEAQGCFFNDRIDLEWSPAQINEIVVVLNTHCMTLGYEQQKFWRKIVRYMKTRLEAWEKVREGG